MEAVHNFEGVLLACLVIAFEEVTARSNLFERIEVRWWLRCCVRVLCVYLYMCVRGCDAGAICLSAAVRLCYRYRMRCVTQLLDTTRLCRSTCHP
jgi:hypothetical protein